MQKIAMLVPWDMMLDTNVQNLRTMFKASLRKSRGVVVDICIEYWMATLEATYKTKKGVYIGPALTARAFQHSFEWFAILIGKLTKSATAMEAMEIGLAHSDKGINAFHYNFLMVIFYPVAVLARVSKAEDSETVQHDMVISLKRDIGPILKLHGVVDAFWKGCYLEEYFEKLEAQPELLKKMKTLRLPLSEAFKKAGP